MKTSFAEPLNPFNTKYAFVTAYTENYKDGMQALKNSIKKHCPNIDFHYYQGESVEDTAIGRFDFACKVAENYDAICLLDADMFLTSDPSVFFSFAEKGGIITGSNGMIINFNSDYQKKYQIDLHSKDYIYTKTHTTVPIFLNKDNVDWFKRLYDSRRVDSFDDFLYLNIIGIEMGKYKDMICMPPYTFTGIHHWFLKPETSVRMADDLLLSGTEEQVYMVHGKWWDETWRRDLMPTMERYLKDHDFGKKAYERVADAIKILRGRFEYYYNLSESV